MGGVGRVVRHILTEGTKTPVHLSSIESEFKEFSSEHGWKKEKTFFNENYLHIHMGKITALFNSRKP